MLRLILLLSLTGTLGLGGTISADLLVVTYLPLKFNLTFSEPVDLPKFQLLFNDIPIRWDTSDSDKSKSFIVNAYTDNLNPADNITEKYVLMFTEPLTIADGNLSLDSFLLRGRRTYNFSTTTAIPIREISSHFILQASTKEINIAAIFIVSLYYFFSYTTLIGLNGFYFVSVFAYICMKTPLFTALDYDIAYYLMLDPSSIKSNEVFKLIYICIPHILVFATFVIGAISRLKVRQVAEKSILWNYFYNYLTYRLFIVTWGMMITPIFCNVAQIYHEYTTFLTIHPIIIKLYIYFSCTSIAFYCYVCFLTVNPQLGQNDEKWKKYVNSSHFNLMEGFYLGTDITNWMKRNTILIFTILRIALLIFISFNIVGIPNLFYQIIQLIFVFTVSPYKHGFFNRFLIWIQICIIVFYLFRYIVTIFMEISEEITTSTDIARILITTITFFSLISLTFFVVGAYELFKRIKSARNNYKDGLKYMADENNIRKAKYSVFMKEDEKEEHEKRKASEKKKKKSPEKKLLDKDAKEERFKTMKSLKLTQELNLRAQSFHEGDIKNGKR